MDYFYDALVVFLELVILGFHCMEKHKFSFGVLQQTETAWEHFTNTVSPSLGGPIM